VPKEYKECEECRTRTSLRAFRCDACGGRLKLHRRGLTSQDRMKGHLIAFSVGLVVAFVGILVHRFI
jgi:hypothetical protein